MLLWLHISTDFVIYYIILLVLLYYFAWLFEHSMCSYFQSLIEYVWCVLQIAPNVITEYK